MHSLADYPLWNLDDKLLIGLGSAFRCFQTGQRLFLVRMTMTRRYHRSFHRSSYKMGLRGMSSCLANFGRLRQQLWGLGWIMFWTQACLECLLKSFALFARILHSVCWLLDHYDSFWRIYLLTPLLCLRRRLFRGSQLCLIGCIHTKRTSFSKDYFWFLTKLAMALL